MNKIAEIPLVVRSIAQKAPLLKIAQQSTWEEGRKYRGGVFEFERMQIRQACANLAHEFAFECEKHFRLNTIETSYGFELRLEVCALRYTELRDLLHEAYQAGYSDGRRIPTIPLNKEMS